MNVRKLTFGLVALVGFGLAITLNAFTADKATVLKYRYTGNTLAGTTNLANWSDVSDQPNPTGCDGDEIPCLVEFRDDEYADMDAFLDAHVSPTAIANSGYVAAQKDAQ